MKVTLMNHTQDAADLLIFSKKTRLMRNVKDYDAVVAMSEEEKAKELDYIFKTVGSSLEFVDYTFLIEGVTRAFTHQLVRHRVGTAFAQQTMRAVDMSESFYYLATGKCGDKSQNAYDEYKDTMGHIRDGYRDCILNGAEPQDARGLLPTNILTNILFKCNLRTLAGIMNVRLCFKTQGEFQDVAKAMRSEVLRTHPWATRSLQCSCCHNGSCAFPNFTDCPVRPKLPVVDLEEIRRVHSAMSEKGFSPQAREDKDGWAPMPNFGDLMTMESFIAACECGGFIDYDGSGQYSDGERVKYQSNVLPSEVKKGTIDKSYSHIVWYNR